MKLRASIYRTWLVLSLIAIALLIATYATTNQRSANVPHLAALTSQLSTATSEPYLTPTPAVPLPSDEVYKRENSYAGTATRIAQLTHVPTWPPGRPRIYPSIPPKTPFSPIERRVAGVGKIVESGFVGDLPVVYGVFANQWHAEVGGLSIRAYAGTKSLIDGLNRGVVVIRIFDSNRTDIELESYETPQRRGIVEVVDAVGQRLTLRAEDGTLFYFDIPTRQWVSPPPLPTPSISVQPLPTLSPGLSPIPSVPPLP